MKREGFVETKLIALTEANDTCGTIFMRQQTKKIYTVLKQQQLKVCRHVATVETAH